MHWVGSIFYYIEPTGLVSAANQNRVLRHQSRQPVRMEYYVTRELSATIEDPSRLSARVGLL